MNQLKEILRVGAGEADITPAKGIQLAGDIGRYRPVEEIRDPLYAKALIIESGGRKACFVVLDVLAITRQWADEIRGRAARQFGINQETIMIHVIQNHAAPSVGHCFVSGGRDEFNLFPKEYPWLLGGDDRYNPIAVDGALQAIAQALAALQPVRIRVGRGMDGRVAHNRRFIMRDGKVKTHPKPCDLPDILRVEGPTDPEVGVALIEGLSGQPLAVLLHHTCHPVHGCGQRWVSAGWPGAWCGGVRKLLGPQVMPLVINGACGNIHHRDHLDPNAGKNDTIEIMAARLTETTEQVLKTLRPLEGTALDWRVRHISIPMRRPAEKELEEARRLVKEHPMPIWRKNADKINAEWDWVSAVTRLDLMEYYLLNPNFDYFMQAFRLGDLAIVALPGEPFVEEQLRIKLESPAAFTWIAHMSNAYVGYIPTKEAFERGGFETSTGIGSKLAPEALRTIGDCALELLMQLFQRV